MPLKALSRTFHAGLIVNVTILIAGNPGWFRLLLPVGMLHMLALWRIAHRLTGAPLQAAIASLHKAGFLHTLLGLGAALVMLARGSDDGLLAHGDQVSSTLAPLGTALVPHVLGIWAGHSLDLTYGTEVDPSEVDRRLTESVARALAALVNVERAATEFSTRVDSALRGAGDVTRIVCDGVSRLGAVVREGGEAAHKFRHIIDDVAHATHQIHVVHGQLLELLQSALLLKAHSRER